MPLSLAWLVRATVVFALALLPALALASPVTSP